jgi:hypothetical protein
MYGNDLLQALLKKQRRARGRNSSRRRQQSKRAQKSGIRVLYLAQRVRIKILGSEIDDLWAIRSGGSKRVFEKFYPGGEPAFHALLKKFVRFTRH